MMCDNSGEIVPDTLVEVLQDEEEIKWNIERSMEDRYLVVEGKKRRDTFEEEMLLQNQISGLLPMETRWKDGAKEYRYCITGCRCLEEELKGRKISGEEYQRLFSEIFECMSRGKKYLLQEDSFLLSKDSIFIHEGTGVVEICYVPDYEKALVTQFRELSEWLLDYVDTNDKQAVYCGYAFHVVAHSDACSFRGLEEVLQNEIEEDDEVQRTLHEKNCVQVSESWVDAEPIIDETTEYATTEVQKAGEKAKRGQRREIWSMLKGIALVLILVAVVFWAMN